MERTHFGQHGEDCFGCRVQTVQFDPRATPSRRNKVAPRTPNNSWERGVWRDGRGMPYLDKDNKEIGLKALADNRHHYDGQVRELKQIQTSTHTSTKE